ncbi:MAG: hypothetical protein ACRDQ7_27985 [Haloechinothrix sp.]
MEIAVVRLTALDVAPRLRLDEGAQSCSPAEPMLLNGGADTQEFDVGDAGPAWVARRGADVGAQDTAQALLEWIVGYLCQHLCRRHGWERGSASSFPYTVRQFGWLRSGDAADAGAVAAKK